MKKLQQIINNQLIKKNSVLNVNKINSNKWKENNKEFIKKVIYHTNFLSADYSFAERILCIHNGINYIKICPICKKNKLKIKHGKFLDYCSMKCINQSPAVKNKKIEAYLKKYGVSNPSQSPAVKNKKIEAYLKKYGVSNPMKSDIVKEIYKTKFNEKYGVNNPFQLDNVQKKIKKTNKEKYNELHFNKTTQFKEKVRSSHLNHFFIKIESNFTDIRPLFKIHEYNGTKSEKYPFECKNCKFKFISSIDNGHIPKCPNCFPPITNRSIAENEISEFLMENYNGVILKNNRSMIYPYELDIYLPELKLAIEYNGIPWHSENFGGKNNKYHIKKTKLCEKLGIQLIHIFDFDWDKKKDIIKILLMKYIGKIKKKPVTSYTIKKINIVETNIFLDKYCLQHQNQIYDYSIGILLNNRLLEISLFKKIDNNTWEMSNCSGCHLIKNSIELILKKFIQLYNPHKIIVKIDRRFLSGKSYEKLGFNLINIEPPSNISLDDDKVWDCGKFIYSLTVLKKKF